MGNTLMWSLSFGSSAFPLHAHKHKHVNSVFSNIVCMCRANLNSCIQGGIQFDSEDNRPLSTYGADRNTPFHPLRRHIPNACITCLCHPLGIWCSTSGSMNGPPRCEYWNGVNRCSHAVQIIGFPLSLYITPRYGLTRIGSMY